MADPVKAILFDTFGTIVDWRGSIARAGEVLGQNKKLEGIDWDAFARAWRAGYVPGMARVMSGERSWTTLDVIHRERLDAILCDFDLESAFSEAERADFNLVWHRLDPWPDSVPGLERIKQDYLISPLSNGSLVLLSSMAKRAGIPWDFILSSSTFKAYKPAGAVYRGAIEILDLEPHEVMMVAAHNDDLAAARTHGMRTAYINRPYEYGTDQVADFEATQDWDVITDTITGLADTLDQKRI